MATVRIITAMTIDGFLPDADNPRMRWLMTDAKGFRYWHDIGTYTLEADYPVLDLVCDKDSTDKSCIYTAGVSDLDGMELMNPYISKRRAVRVDIKQIRPAQKRYMPKHLPTQSVIISQ